MLQADHILLSICGTLGSSCVLRRGTGLLRCVCVSGGREGGGGSLPISPSSDWHSVLRCISPARTQSLMFIHACMSCVWVSCMMRSRLHTRLTQWPATVAEFSDILKFSVACFAQWATRFTLISVVSEWSEIISKIKMPVYKTQYITVVLLWKSLCWVSLWRLQYQNTWQHNKRLYRPLCALKFPFWFDL